MSGAYTITLNVDSTAFTAYSSSGFIDDNIATIQSKMMAQSSDCSRRVCRPKA